MIHYDSKIDFRLPKVTSGIFRVYMCQRPPLMIKALPGVCVCVWHQSLSSSATAILPVLKTHTHTPLIPLKMTQMGWKQMVLKMTQDQPIIQKDYSL